MHMQLLSAVCTCVAPIVNFKSQMNWHIFTYSSIKKNSIWTTNQGKRLPRFVVGHTLSRLDFFFEEREHIGRKSLPPTLSVRNSHIEYHKLNSKKGFKYKISQNWTAKRGRTWVKKTTNELSLGLPTISRPRLRRCSSSSQICEKRGELWDNKKNRERMNRDSFRVSVMTARQ